MVKYFRKIKKKNREKYEMRKFPFLKYRKCVVFSIKATWFVGFSAFHVRV